MAKALATDIILIVAGLLFLVLLLLCICLGVGLCVKSKHKQKKDRSQFLIQPDSRSSSKHKFEDGIVLNPVFDEIDETKAVDMTDIDDDPEVEELAKSWI